MRLFVVRRKQAKLEETIQCIQAGSAHTLSGMTSDSRLAVMRLPALSVDVVICDAIMPIVDGPSLARQFSNLWFLLLVPKGMQIFLPQNAVACGEDEDLLAALLDMRNRPLREEMRLALHGTLLSLGFSSQKRGTQAIAYALELILRDESCLLNLRDEVYRPYAALTCATVASVERNIRYSIECAWNAGELSRLDAVFGYTVEAERGKPTNRAFFAQIAEHIRLKTA